MDSSRSDLQLRDTVRILRKRKRLAITLFLLCFGAAAYQAIFGAKVFQGKATLEVQQPSQFIIRADAFGGSNDRLTPEAEDALIQSEPYQSLIRALLTLAQGYGIDLTERRSEEDITRLFEKALFRYPLPKLMGYELLRGKGGPTFGIAPGTDAAGRAEIDRTYQRMTAEGPDAFDARLLSSSEQDQAIQQAGALAELGRRVGVDLFRGSAAQVMAAAARVMDTRFIRTLPGDPMRGRTWDQVPSAERGSVIEAAYRVERRKRPGSADKAELQERISGQEVKDTGMLDVLFNSGDPTRAMLGADAVVDASVWKNAYARKKETAFQRRFLEVRLFGIDGNGGLKAELARNDQKNALVLNHMHVGDIGIETKAKSQQAQQQQEAILNAQADLAASQAALSTLEQEKAGVPATVRTPTVAGPTPDAPLHAELAGAQADLKGDLQLYGPDNPKLAADRAKVKELRLRSAAEDSLRDQPRLSTTQPPNPVRQSLDTAIIEARQKVQSDRGLVSKLQAQTPAIEAQLGALPWRQAAVAGLMRDAGTLAKTFETLDEQYELARLKEATTLPTTKVVELALEPGRKIKPRRLLTLALGMLVGLVLAMGGALLAEMLDNTIRTPEEAGRALAGVPLIGAIPERTGGGTALIMHDDPRSPSAEAYRGLRSAVRFTSLDQPLRTLLITSAGAEEGKSTTAANLAAALANAGSRVILVDADLRKPALHRVFELSNATGLTTVLLGEARLADALQNTDVPGLQVLTSGPLPPNPGEALESAAMRRLMDELKASADQVVFDGAPVVAVTDARALAGAVDGVLLVMGSGQVVRESAVRAQELLSRSHARMVGVVLNRMDAATASGLYEDYQRYTASVGNGKRPRKEAG